MPVNPRVRGLSLHAAAAVSIISGYASAQPSDAVDVASPEVERSSFLGRWELDLTRMPDTYGPPPKRVIYSFKDLGSGKWLTNIDVTGRDDSVRHVAIEYRRDGQAVPGKGDVADESAAVNSPAPNVLVMSLSRNKGLESVRVYAISADGKEMTESAADVNDEGAPFVRNFHFRRVP